MTMRLVCFMLISSCALGVENDCDSEGCGAEDDDASALLQTKFEQQKVGELDAAQKTDLTIDAWKETGSNNHSDLLMAIPLVLVNLTNYSGLISVNQDGPYPEQDVSHKFGNESYDESLLFDMVHGFFVVLHKKLNDGGGDGTHDAQKYCPFNNASVIKRCIDMALCLVQSNVSSQANVETFTLFEEVQSRFEEVSWDLIISSLQKEAAQNQEIADDFRIPTDYTCDSTFDWLDPDDPDDSASGTGTGLLETKARKTSEKAAAYRTSVALVEAAKATHVALDAHTQDSSVKATLEALYQAWETPCKLLKCDHKNYYDLYGASHSHSLALLDAGASARHMRVHIRTRVRLEQRMQRFLGEHGVNFMDKMYSAEGTTTEAQMQAYVARGRSSFMGFVQKYLSTQGVNDVWLDLVSRERMKVFFEKQGQLEDFNSLWEAHDNANTNDIEEDQEALVQVEDMIDDQLAGRRRRRLLGRRRRRLFKAVVNVVKKVGNTIANAVNTAVQFIVETFACFGQAKTMVATGYCKKFGGPTYGAGVSFTASAAVSLNSLISGTFVPNLKVGIGAVFGAVPFSPVTGGLRTGVGISGGVGCSATGCNVGIAVGAAASALIPTNSPECFAGGYLGDFRCMIGAGAAVTVLCCNFNMVTGSESCR